MEPATKSSESFAFQAYLAEYTRIWAEVGWRFDNQRLAFNVTITFVGALLVAHYGGHVTDDFYFFAPLVLAPLGFIFFDNELMIWAIVHYTHTHLRTQMTRIADDPGILAMEEKRFADKGARRLHPLLSASRWMVFVVPSVFCFCVAARATPEWWRTRWWVVAVIDLLVMALLCYAMIRALILQTIWRVKIDANSPPKAAGPKQR